MVLASRRGRDRFTQGTAVPAAGAGAPSVRMGDVAEADDGVAGADAPAPVLQQVAVHLVDVPERAVPGEQHRAVPQVQVGPDPRRLRHGFDDRDALARFD